MAFAAAALPYLAVAGTVVSAVGAIGAGAAQAAQSGQQADMARYQAQVSRNNEIIANQMADREIAAGQRKAEMESMKTAAKVARVRAGQAASGVDVNTGSAVDVQASERALGKIDAETVLSDAQLKAYGFRSQAANYGTQAGLYDAQGRNYDAQGSAARTGSYFKAFGTLLSGASSMPASWFGKGTESAGPGAGLSAA